MNIQELKEIIKNLPDEMEVWIEDFEEGMSEATEVEVDETVTFPSGLKKVLVVR